MKMKGYHWKRYFGGVSFLLIILQLLTGIFLTLFYKPHLKEAYSSIQYLYNHLSSSAWVRDTHRWIATFLFVSILVHTVRSFLRKDFLNPEKRMLWLTGFLFLLPMVSFIVTGIILPWEWKGYWFMEMVPNYAGSIPYIGDSLKGFLINAFTLPRNLVAHILILPIISIILIDLHFLAKLRRRGVFKYLSTHLLISIPIYIIVIALAVYIPMPSQDPEIIPFPFNGTYIPAPEWFFLILLLPFMYFKDFMAPFLGLYLPLITFLALAFLPYYLKNERREGVKPNHPRKKRVSGLKHLWNSFIGVKAAKKGIAFLTVSLIVAVFLGLLYMGSYRSPTFGCSGCHNLYSGARMGVPPEIFKDREKIPLLNDNEWMMRHWFYPQEVW